LTFDRAGCLRAAYDWRQAGVPGNAVFAPELSLARSLTIRPLPDTELWRSEITTVARSERGFEETVQGFSITPRWPAHIGQAGLELGP
jgi:hypothetical protein